MDNEEGMGSHKLTRADRSRDVMETPPNARGWSYVLPGDNEYFSPTTPFYLVPGHSCSAKGCAEENPMAINTRALF